MSESQGNVLKTRLGLSAFPYVMYARLIGVGGYRIYFVFFDSRIPFAHFNSYEAFRKEYATAIAFSSQGRRLAFTNLLPIEDWSGTERGSLFIRVDLSGRFAKTQNYVAEKICTLLVEDMTLTDFKNPDAIDTMTQRFRTQRRSMLGKETAKVKLMDVRWSKRKDCVEFRFRSISTPNTPTKQKADQKQNFALTTNRLKVYTLLIRLNNFFTWMLDTLPDGQQLTIKDMKDALIACPVQFWSNSPAWHWQGLNYNMSQLGCSIYPTNIAPHFWNQAKYHGPNGMLDKHLGALVRNISFFINQMTAMLNSRLTQAGIIKNVKYNFQ